MATRRLYTQPEIDRIRRLVDTHGPTTAAQIVGTCTETIAGMRRRGWTVGHKGQRPRSVPTDFSIQAANLTIHQLAAHYGAALGTVCRWAAAVRRTPMVGHRRQALPVPADVEQLVAELGPTAAARRYGVHPDTVRKWLRAVAAAAAERRQRRGVGWVDRLAPSSGERPGSLPLTDPDAPAVPAAGVSAPEAAQSRHLRSRAKPEASHA